MLYSNEPVYLDGDTDRRANNDDTAAYRTDKNLTYRIAQLKSSLFKKNVYRILLSALCDLGRVNFAEKTDTRIILTLEKNLNKLFETSKKAATIPENPDAFINIYDRPYISYPEINLTQQAGLYDTGILKSETAWRQGVLPAPFQQEFGKSARTQDFTCTFKGAQ